MIIYAEDGFVQIKIIKRKSKEGSLKAMNEQHYKDFFEKSMTADSYHKVILDDVIVGHILVEDVLFFPYIHK